MKLRRSRVPAFFFVLVLVFGVLALSGCSKKKPVTTSLLPSPFGDEKLAELKVTANDDWVYIAQKKGWFTERFEQYGVKVSLVQGTLGNEAQLMARKDLHFANRMLYPYLLYRSQGADLMAVQVSTHPKPDIASVLVLKDSPIQTFEDLKGKKVASWRAGCPYMVLYEMAEGRGWVQGKDWSYVNIPSGEQKNALLSKEIDAVSGHLLGDVAQLLISNLAREVAYPAEDSVYINGGGVTVIFTSSEFAKNYPNITKALIDLQIETEQWMLANLDEATKLVEGITRVPSEVSRLAWQRMGSTWETTNLDFETIKKQTKDMQDWLVEHGDIEVNKQVHPADLFDPQYFN
jgi:ABC-type nitrate/sulfonate/bicarbonate transport system substrate-binding protein